MNIVVAEGILPVVNDTLYDYCDAVLGAGLGKKEPVLIGAVSGVHVTASKGMIKDYSKSVHDIFKLNRWSFF